MNGTDVRSGVNRGENVQSADQGDVSIPGQQHAHGIGVTSNMHIFDLDIA